MADPNANAHYGNYAERFRRRGQENVFVEVRMAQISGLNLRELFRFGFAGVFVLVSAHLLFPEQTKLVVERLGAVGTPLALLGSGALVYGLYRPFLLERILMPFRIWVHGYCDRFFSGNGKPVTSSFNYLTSPRIGVTRRDRVFAFRTVRDKLVADRNPDLLARLRESNDQNHFLYVTGIIILFGGIIGMVRGPGRCFWLGWAVFGLMVVFLGMASDYLLDRWFCDILHDIGDSDVRSHLRRLEYLREETEPHTRDPSGLNS